MRAAKTFAIASILASTVAGSAFAGGFNVEVVEPPVIPVQVFEPEPAPSSSYGFIIPIVALAALAALAISQQD